MKQLIVLSKELKRIATSYTKKENDGCKTVFFSSSYKTTFNNIKGARKWSFKKVFH